METDYDIPCDKIEINIGKETSKEFFRWAYQSSKGKCPIMLFMNPYYEKKDIMFLLAHGDSMGNIKTDDGTKPPSRVLMELIDSGVVDPKTIKAIYTISCYGGTQEVLYVDGVLIQSIHNVNTEIDITCDGSKLIIDLQPNSNTTKRAIKLFYGKAVFAAIHGSNIGRKLASDFKKFISSYFKRSCI